MNELSLFSGAGGGLLASRLLGWRTIGYVEIDDYCQQVLAARIADGILDPAPIFGDIAAFIRDGYAERYQGLVDVISAGFPCQPFSSAGKMAGGDDPRNQWPATLRCAQIIQPEWLFLENVAALARNPYFGNILRDLAEGGYDATWRVLSAAELGAPHKRDRVWIVAHTNSQQLQGGQVRPEREKSGQRSSVREGSETNPNANSSNVQTNADEQEIADSPQIEQHPHRLRHPTYWQAGSPVEPSIRRVADGLATWVDQIRAIGNGQVPSVARSAWRLLSHEETQA
jgi:DNA (cytosine-5)-methyltransferase 1